MKVKVLITIGGQYIIGRENPDGSLSDSLHLQLVGDTFRYTSIAVSPKNSRLQFNNNAVLTLYDANEELTENYLGVLKKQGLIKLPDKQIKMYK